MKNIALALSLSLFLLLLAHTQVRAQVGLLPSDLPGVPSFLSFPSFVPTDLPQIPTNLLPSDLADPTGTGMLSGVIGPPNEGCNTSVTNFWSVNCDYEWTLGRVNFSIGIINYYIGPPNEGCNTGINNWISSVNCYYEYTHWRLYDSPNTVNNIIGPPNEGCNTYLRDWASVNCDYEYTLGLINYALATQIPQAVPMVGGESVGQVLANALATMIPSTVPEVGGESVGQVLANTTGNAVLASFGFLQATSNNLGPTENFLGTVISEIPENPNMLTNGTVGTQFMEWLGRTTGYGQSGGILDDPYSLPNEEVQAANQAVQQLGLH